MREYLSSNNIHEEKVKWLFNFSSSYIGGGLIRTLETVKWFDNNRGAYFIINNKIKHKVSVYNKKNRYFFIKDHKIRRLINDGYYMPRIIKKIGRPDIYFSYGIPVFNDIANINWFHISNSLTLKTKDISLPFFKRIQMKILKKRIIKSMKITNISTGESKFSINLLRDENKNQNLTCFYDVLPNGFDNSLLRGVLEKGREESEKYGITIGTFTYKKIEIALKLFHQIKNKYNLKKFIIIGNPNEVPKFIINDRFVEFRSNISREELFYLLYNSEFYISASQIENSSIAALEALLLSKNIILSNIPSHNEMLINFKTKNLILESSNTTFKVVKNLSGNFHAASWADICKKLFKIINDYKSQKTNL
jgi:glycosyltransferase involved in cell wall biosynthesis